MFFLKTKIKIGEDDGRWAHKKILINRAAKKNLIINNHISPVAIDKLHFFK